MKRKASRKPASSKRKVVPRPLGVPSALADAAQLLNLASMLGLPAAGEAVPA